MNAIAKIKSNENESKAFVSYVCVSCVVTVRSMAIRTHENNTHAFIIRLCGMKLYKYLSNCDAAPLCDAPTDAPPHDSNNATNAHTQPKRRWPRKYHICDWGPFVCHVSLVRTENLRASMTLRTRALQADLDAEQRL